MYVFSVYIHCKQEINNDIFIGPMLIYNVELIVGINVSYLSHYATGYVLVK